MSSPHLNKMVIPGNGRNLFSVLWPSYLKGESAGCVVAKWTHGVPDDLIGAGRQLWHQYDHQGLIGGIDFGILLVHFVSPDIEDLDFAERALDFHRKPDLHHGGRSLERAAYFGFGMIEEGMRFREGRTGGEESKGQD